MSQKRYFEFKDDDKTISLNNWLMGITESGVYAGFDFQRQSGLTFKLIHTSTGQVVNNADNVPSLPMGVLVTKTGAVIKEDEELSFVFTANGSTSKRTDTVYAEHTYIKDSIGGIQCTYGVLVGTTTLPNPNNQVAIGYLRVKGLATDTLSTSVTFEKAKRPFPKNGAYNSQKSDVFSFPMTGTTTTRIITLEDDLRTRTVQIEDNAVLPKRILIQSKSAFVDFNYSKTYREFHFIIPPIVNADKDFTLSIGTYYINGVEENFDFLVLTADELMNSGQIVVHCTDKALISVTKSIPAIERQRYAVIEANNTIPTATVQDFTIPDGLGEPTNRIAKYEDILSKTPRYLKVPNTRLGGIELNSTPVTGTTMSIEVTSATGMLLESNLNTDAQIVGGITTGMPGFAFKKIQHSNDNVPLFYKQGSVIELRYNSYGKWSLLNEGQDDADKQLEDGLLAKTEDLNTVADDLVTVTSNLNAIKKFFKSIISYTYTGTSDDVPSVSFTAGSPDELIHTITLPSDGISRFIEINAKCNAEIQLNILSSSYTRLQIRLENSDGTITYTGGEIKTRVDRISGSVDISYCFNHAGDGGVYKVWLKFLNGTTFYLTNIQSKAIGTPNVVF